MTRYLFDTHLLLWAAAADPRLPPEAAKLLSNPGDTRLFSAISLGEIAIKWRQGRPDFPYAPLLIREGAMGAGFVELPLTGIHACRLADLPPVHKDPFDRLMVAQALAEGVTFVTADAVLAGYPGQIIVV